MIKSLIKNLSNLPGWTTNQKIVVIESDDWGAIRMASKEALERLEKKGVLPFDDDERIYLHNDSLATEKDFSELFEILESVKDAQNKSAVFTAVAVVANPDFEKIQQSDFKNYYYEPFTETLKKYPDHQNSFESWKKGIKSRLFVPQFHGREHLNVINWLKALQANNKDTLLAFDEKIYGITPSKQENFVSFQAAFDVYDPIEINYHKQILEEGLDLFENLFGYKASFFVPTNGPFNNQLEEVLAKKDIKYIGTSKIQKQPIGFGKNKISLHYLGQKNKWEQTYLTRNAFFEPSSNLKNDWVNACLSEIEIAFKWKKPAVISSHRTNYTGFINPKNRENGLKQLKLLLTKILHKWPDVIFLTSDELGNLMTKEHD
jgi:hypothetical protein